MACMAITKAILSIPFLIFNLRDPLNNHCNRLRVAMLPLSLNRSFGDGFQKHKTPPLFKEMGSLDAFHGLLDQSCRVRSLFRKIFVAEKQMNGFHPISISGRNYNPIFWGW